MVRIGTDTTVNDFTEYTERGCGLDTCNINLKEEDDDDEGKKA